MSKAAETWDEVYERSKALSVRQQKDKQVQDAAQDMLAALEALVAIWDLCDDVQYQQAEVKAARAAIRKAKRKS
jgi:hypothetical protein